MAQYLTADDLVRFLRSRKSVNCKVAADWCEENPAHPATLAEVDRLESLLLQVGVDGGVNTDTPSRPITARCAVLVAFGEATGDGGRLFRQDVWERFPPQTFTTYHWQDAVGRASLVFARRMPAWAAVIVRKVMEAARR